MARPISGIHALFTKCCGCGDKLEEGAIFTRGVPVCLQCHDNDGAKLRHLGNCIINQSKAG